MPLPCPVVCVSCCFDPLLVTGLLPSCYLTSHVHVYTRISAVSCSSEVAVEFTDDAKRRPSLEKRQPSPDINAPIYGELVVLG